MTVLKRLPQPGERWVESCGEGFKVAECVGIASQDIPAALVRKGDRLTITLPGFYGTREQAREALGDAR